MDRNALLPPAEKCDVSILRLNYTDLNFCKRHTKALRIGACEYWGLGAFKNCHTSILNAINLEINAIVICSPIDEKNNYIEDISQVTTDTLGLPMHADLRYSEPIPSRGTPATKHRKYAQELLKLSGFIKDKESESDSWVMGSFCFKV
ncbi:MAG: hypothetical protein GZ091_06540 [Paludibacter sp.]|nr:hypothetical protein [Paludibacter sp.]